MKVTTVRFGDGGARGVVLAVSGGWATLMSPDGSFRRVRARPAWRVGDDVLVTAEVTPLRRVAPWLGSAAAAVAAAAVTFGVMSNLAANRTILYVDIAGSHSATLAVNADGQVLSAFSDGKGPLPIKVRRGENLATAVEDLARAEAMTPAGYVAGAAIVTFYAPKGITSSASVRRSLRTAELAAARVDATVVSMITAGAVGATP